MSKNREIAEVFERIADILDILDENPFRVKAYRNAARNIQESREDIEPLARQGELSKIQGIGSDLAAKIGEYLGTGEIADYEELKQKIPAGLPELLAIRGLGPKTLSKLYRELGVVNLETLQKAIGGDEILKFRGMGGKKIEELKRGVEIFKQGISQKHLGIALPFAEDLVERIEKAAGVAKSAPAGSLRRMTETVGEIEIVIESSDGASALDGFVPPNGVLSSGDMQASAALEGGIEARIRLAPSGSFGASLLWHTGSEAHKARLESIARERGLTINERGVFRGDEKIAGEGEEGIYNALGLLWIPPELREDRGEIEAALLGELPALVELCSIRGDLHMHSNWSDGRASIEEMARAAMELGYDYIAITDHSPSSRIANGLSVERLYEKMKEVEAVRGKISGIKILMGAEVDIKNDGSLDYPDEVLRELDVVVASVHSGFQMDRDTMTRRIAAALRNPFVHALGHPTGRLIGERAPYEIDMDEIIRVAKEYGKALEVNSSYLRLDLKDVHARAAIDAGVKIIISTDAHRPEQLRYMRLGVATARRGWVQKKDVINTLGFEELREWLAGSRKRQ